MPDITWKKLGETSQKVGYKTILHKNFLMPNGQEKNFTTLDNRGGSVCTFAVTKDKRIVVARQYRPGLEIIMDELPGGGIDPGEEPLEAAKRELLEETGYIGDFEKLGIFARDAYIDGHWHYFLATNCEQLHANPENDEFEFIEIATITVQELLENITTAKMSDPALALLALRKLGW